VRRPPLFVGRQPDADAFGAVGDERDTLDGHQPSLRLPSTAKPRSRPLHALELDGRKLGSGTEGALALQAPSLEVDVRSCEYALTGLAGGQTMGSY
jgi:hypothetical protein